MQRQSLINADGEVRELATEDFALARPIAETLPEDLAQVLFSHQKQLEEKGVMQKRNTGKTPKQLVTIRLSADVVEKFRDGGKGWQTRINEVLRQYVAQLK
ncbi:BrnA antitoxin family protein [Neisseria basseii]|uniref:BrnA antitoxin family protein n=1 Tax=Neisseria basseii TaxID=2830650 RepID=UPI0026598BB5|nr:BrnA antitoxin family protein [Neisseria basseii]